MSSIWTEFKALFNSDVEALVRENERLRLDNDLLRSENKRCVETKERSETYMQKCDEAFYTWVKMNYSSNFKAMQNEMTLSYLQNTDDTVAHVKSLEDRLKYRCDEVRELDSKLDEAKSQIDDLNAFIKTLPEGYKYAYDLFMKNNKEQERDI